MLNENQLKFIDSHKEVFDEGTGYEVLNLIFQSTPSELMLKEQAGLIIQVNEVLDKPYPLFIQRYRITSREFLIGVFLGKGDRRLIPLTLYGFAGDKNLARMLASELGIPIKLATKVANLPIRTLEK